MGSRPALSEWLLFWADRGLIPYYFDLSGRLVLNEAMVSFLLPLTRGLSPEHYPRLRQELMKLELTMAGMP
jgi:hypothetical protein